MSKPASHPAFLRALLTCLLTLVMLLAPLPQATVVVQRPPQMVPATCLATSVRL